MQRARNTPFPQPNSSTTNLLPSGQPRASSASRPYPPSSVAGPSAAAKRTPSIASYASNIDRDGRLSESYPASLSDKYSLAPSPAQWGMSLLMNDPEPDDILHNPNPRRDKKSDRGGTIFTARGLANLGCLALLAGGCMMLFAGYPIISHFTSVKMSNQGGFNLGGTNGTGQVPDFPGNFGLIDKHTPTEAHTLKSYHDDDELVLVFSDEFNVDGRSFYPGDDPFWEGVDLHYWVTNDLEWYDPGQVTTSGGSLRIRLDKVDPIDNHNMTYKSGMIQTWNKFCFTGGLVVASVQLPGSSSVSGFWPAVWTMGNLGRAGYGSTTDGVWPFSYDECDVGTLPNQTYPGTNLPEAALTNGDPEVGGVLSFLPGQRLSRCTCPGESHPGPMRKDGSYVGRAAPEIDVLEATVTDGIGHVSLSAQWAPYNAAYQTLNQNTSIVIDDPQRTQINSFRGGRYQQTVSGLGLTNPNCYETPGTCYALYGFEYKPGFDDAYITWINEVRAWTFYPTGLAADPLTEIGRRTIAEEPMYLITNLGISEGFGVIDLENLKFPGTMSVDYIRVYQRKDAINVGCDPKNFPTMKYIEEYKELYSNPNLTVWEDTKQPWPKNRLNGGC
ncbi:hypothetical protein D9613_009885 [Agrocybe pediades]|uniref:GH16 domain-containing protein n=1 Tax=Agrocybe pediades TaxID=84607 RepID=A0A8H4VSJ5_9AGAR|nr:hypothetical protein D9613_009885 [Agrocybe pediades]